MNFAFTTFFGRQIASKIDKTTRVRKSCKKVCNAFLFPSKQIIYPWKSEFAPKNPNIWMFEAWIIKIAPLVANEKPQNMWERDNSVLSSDLCNYIPAVPSWWEICRFWSCLESSSEICWRVEDYLFVNTFSFFDLTTSPLRQWNEWQFEVIILLDFFPFSFLARKLKYICNVVA